MLKKKSPSVKELNETINNEKDKYVRLFAEFENYKRRTAKERIDLFKTAGKEVLSSLIPVVEDFKRALNQEDVNQEDNQGIKLIYNKLIETLKTKVLKNWKLRLVIHLTQKFMKQLVKFLLKMMIKREK